MKNRWLKTWLTRWPTTCLNRYPITWLTRQEQNHRQEHLQIAVVVAGGFSLEPLPFCLKSTYAKFVDIHQQKMLCWILSKPEATTAPPYSAKLLSSSYMDESAKSKSRSTLSDTGWLILTRGFSSNKALDILFLSLFFPYAAYHTVSLLIRMHLEVFIFDIWKHAP